MIFQRIEQAERFRIILQLQIAESGAKLRFRRKSRFGVLLKNRCETYKSIRVFPQFARQHIGIKGGANDIVRRRPIDQRFEGRLAVRRQLGGILQLNLCRFLVLVVLGGDRLVVNGGLRPFSRQMMRPRQQVAGVNSKVLIERCELPERAPRRRIIPQRKIRITKVIDPQRQIATLRGGRIDGKRLDCRLGFLEFRGADQHFRQITRIARQPFGFNRRRSIGGGRMGFCLRGQERQGRGKIMGSLVEVLVGDLQVLRRFVGRASARAYSALPIKRWLYPR